MPDTRTDLSTSDIPFMVLDLNDLYNIISFIIKEMDIKESFQSDYAQTIIKVKIGDEFPLWFLSFIEFKSHLWSCHRHQDIKYLEVTVSAIDDVGNDYSVGLFLNHNYSVLIGSSFDRDDITKIFHTVQSFLKSKSRKLSWIMKRYANFLGITGTVSLIIGTTQIYPTWISIYLSLYSVACYLIIISISYLKSKYLKFNRFNLNVANT